MTEHHAEADLTLTPEGRKRVKQNTCDHKFRGLHEDDAPDCMYCDLDMETYIKSLEAELEKANTLGIAMSGEMIAQTQLIAQIKALVDDTEIDEVTRDCAIHELFYPEEII
jgi:hypothetical protein